MVAALPRNVQLKLEQALSQWRQWRCEPPLSMAPEVVRVLGEGLSNFNVLVASDRQYVVRIDGVNPTQHGLNRQAEWRTLLGAAQQGLAPTARYFNPDLGCLVCDFLAPDPAVEPDMEELASLLRGIHRLPPRHYRLHLGERILRYEKLLEHSPAGLPDRLASCRKSVSALLRELGRQPQPAVLCHNDLLRANRIYSGGRLWAIDWEYSAMGSPWYELAVIIVGDELDQARAEELVSAYLGRPATAGESQQLRRYACLYRYIELLWYCATDRNAPTPGAQERRLTALEQALLSP